VYTAGYSQDSSTTSIPADSSAPTPPSNLTLVSKNTGTITLIWNSSTDDSDSTIYYDIYLNGVPENSVVNDTTVTLVGGSVKPGQTYSIYVRAVDLAFNESDSSNVITVTLKPDTAAPQAPQNFIASQTTPSSVTLSWRPAQDDGDIMLYNLAVDGDTAFTTTPETTFTVWHLDPQTTHTFSIYARDYGQFVSPWSDTVEVSTDAAKGKVLIVGARNPAPHDKQKWYIGDVEMARLIAEKGYAVEWEGFFTKLPHVSRIEGYDLVVVSSTANSITVGGFLKESPTPIIILEVYVADDFGMCPTNVRDSTDTSGARTYLVQGQGYTRGHTTDITMLDSGHPMAGGLTGTFPIAKIPSEMKFVFLPDNAHKVACLADSSEHIVVGGVKEGDTLYDGSVAAGRRAVYGIGEYVPLRFTQQGEQLFQAIVDWSLEGKMPAGYLKYPVSNIKIPLHLNSVMRTLAFDIPEGHPYVFRLTTLRGRQIEFKQGLGPISHHMHFGRLAGGVYIVSLKTGYGTINSRWLLP
jgi:hypothetical protein